MPSLTKPSEVFRQKILPAYEDYRANPLSERHASIVAREVSDNVEWTFKYYKAEDQSRLSGATNLKDFRQSIFARCPELRLMWDLGDAIKHRFLTRPGIPRIVRSATAAYTTRDDELVVAVSQQAFLPAVTAAVNFWKNWQD